jgi:hypothetical protein
MLYTGTGVINSPGWDRGREETMVRGVACSRVLLSFLSENRRATAPWRPDLSLLPPVFVFEDCMEASRAATYTSTSSAQGQGAGAGGWSITAKHIDQSYPCCQEA